MALPAAKPTNMPVDTLAWVEGAKAQITQCEDVSQAQEMAAQAQGILAYLNAKLGRASEEARAVSEVEVLTRKRIGELLPAKKSRKETGQAGGRGKRSPRRGDLSSQRQAEARKLAEIPAATLAAYLDKQRKAGKPASVRGAIKSAKPKPRPPKPTDVDVAQTLSESFERFLVDMRKAITTTASPDFKGRLKSELVPLATDLHKFLRGSFNRLSKDS